MSQLSLDAQKTDLKLLHQAAVYSSPLTQFRSRTFEFKSYVPPPRPEYGCKGCGRRNTGKQALTIYPPRQRCAIRQRSHNLLSKNQRHPIQLRPSSSNLHLALPPSSNSSPPCTTRNSSSATTRQTTCSSGEKASCRSCSTPQLAPRRIQTCPAPNRAEKTTACAPVPNIHRSFTRIARSKWRSQATGHVSALHGSKLGFRQGL